MMEHSLWGNLPLLVRANSKDLVEDILQTLWRTRKVGLDSTDRDVIRNLLQLQNDSDLDPLLVCLRMLIRKCVYENANKDEIQKLIPAEVLPEIQRLLTLLFQKFHNQWREDISKDQVNSPSLNTMGWNMENENVASTDPTAGINLKIQGNTRPNSGETDVNFHLAKDKLETLLKSMNCKQGQPPNNETNR